MPGVPTLAEAGMPEYDAGVWIGLLALVTEDRAACDYFQIRKLGQAVDDAESIANFQRAFTEQDFQEGANAFIEKRPPNFL